MTTIQNCLTRAADCLTSVSDSPHLDSEVLLAFVLEKNRSYLRGWNDKKLNESMVIYFESLLSQRLDGVPIAYLIGTREFWSRNFIVSPDVLIPRPDTELLIELCLAQIPVNQALNILDLGTGSGAIAVTLAAERPTAKIIAVDLSTSALAIAQQNAHQHHCKNIEFILSNWFSAVPKIKFDLIISNPPYISADDEHLTQGDVRFEPKSALIAAENGLSDIRIIATASKRYLKPFGQVLFEHGYNQAEDVQIILQSLNYKNVQTYLDLSGMERVTMGFTQEIVC